MLAHEYGHHIQNLLGTMGKVRTQQGPESDAVRLELQADCYAGMWAGRDPTERRRGPVLIAELTQEDIAQAVAAAKAVGDDRISRSRIRRVDPEGWTHGSAEQRVRWFMTGYEQGTWRPATRSPPARRSSADSAQQRLDLGELPLQRAEVRRHGGVAVLAASAPSPAGDPGQRPVGAVQRRCRRR